MKNTKVSMAAFCGVAVAMNIVLGIITSALKIPLYLDTLGTVLSAALFGPVPGMIVGSLSNIITGLMYSMTDIPFFLVNMTVGLVVGLAVKKFKFTLPVAVVLGLALSVICPAIGTPIGMYVYGGFEGNATDVLVMALVKGGQSIFSASFITKISSNFIDKVGTCLIAYLLIKSLPARFLAVFGKEKEA